MLEGSILAIAYDANWQSNQGLTCHDFLMGTNTALICNNNLNWYWFMFCTLAEIRLFNSELGRKLMQLNIMGRMFNFQKNNK